VTGSARKRLPWGAQDIADGAVTSSKVADGSLTGADLTAETGASIQGGGDTSVPIGQSFMSPIGRSEATFSFAGLGHAVAPVNLTLRNLRVVTDPPGAGNSINVRFVSHLFRAAGPREPAQRPGHVRLHGEAALNITPTR
jgi:hypothetical protein